MLFLKFLPVSFSKFQMTVVKNLMKKPFFFIMDLQVSYDVLVNKMAVLLKVFEIFTEIHFISLFFGIEKVLQPHF